MFYKSEKNDVVLCKINECLDIELLKVRGGTNEKEIYFFGTYSNDFISVGRNS